MALTKEETYTIEDIYALPDGERAELIDGQIYMMTPPRRIHQRIVMELSSTIREYIRQHKGICQVYPAPFAVFIMKDDKNYVEPDISVICDLDKLSDRGCEGAPDWVVEIVSPSSRRMDYSTKTSLYANSGVREYWIVDPEKRRTTLYHYEEDEAPMIVPFDQALPSGIYKDLSVVMDELLK